MKKYFFIAYFLIFASLLPNVVKAEPVNQTEAHKAIVVIRTYASGLDGFLTEWQTGTGVIISSGGLVLTNEHVVSVRQSYDDSERSVGYQVCTTTDAADDADCKYTANVIAKNKTLDLALLQIVPIEGMSTPVSYPYIDLIGEGLVSVGEDVTALGYPSIGGDTISVTKGVISGKANKYNQKWLKTDAVTSFGSSGGALINKAGKLIGITTQISSDVAATLGYAIDVTGIKGWISDNYAKPSVQSAIQDRIISFTKKQKDRNVSNIFLFINEGFSINKPDNWKFVYNSEDRLFVSNPEDSDGGYVSVALARTDHPVDLSYFDLSMKYELTLDGSIAQANFSKNEAVNLGRVQAKHLQINGIQNPVDEYLVANQDTYMQIFYNYGKDEKDKTIVDTIIKSVIANPRPTPNLLQQYTNSSPVFSVKTNPDWYIRKYDSKSTPLEMYSKDFSAKVTVVVEKKNEQTRNLSNDDLLDKAVKLIENTSAASKNANLSVVLVSKDAHVRLANQVPEAFAHELVDANYATGKVLLRVYSVTIPLQDDYITLSMTCFGDDKSSFDKKLASWKSVLSTFSLSTTPNSPATSTVSPSTSTQPVISVPAAGVAGTYDRDRERASASSINGDKKISSNGEVARCVSGTLIKNRSSAAVYYCGANGKRFVFPNAQTYASWYDNFNDVVILTDEELASVQIGGVVTYRPGTRMIKIESAPTVYAVAANGELRPIGSETVAKRLYGDNWNKMIDDISDAFFTNYKVGDAITQ